MIEILILNLKPGTREDFHQLFLESSLPLQKKWKLEVVAHGPSFHDENSYYVLRAFKSLADRQEKEDGFYGSDDWKQGPREALLSRIENISTIVVPVNTFQEWAEHIEIRRDIK